MKNFKHAVVLLALFAVNVPEVTANPPPAYEGRRLYVSYCQYATEPMARVMVLWQR